MRWTWKPGKYYRSRLMMARRSRAETPETASRETEINAAPEKAAEKGSRKMITYETRYQAEKARIKGAEIVVKVCGGYAVMSYDYYYTWRKQK